jgi:hypothetical protein
VLPFLYATDETSVLIGALSDRGNRTSASPDPARRPSVLATLKDSLVEISIVRESLDRLRSIVEQRFDRPLFDGGGMPSD